MYDIQDIDSREILYISMHFHFILLIFSDHPHHHGEEWEDLEGEEVMVSIEVFYLG